MKTTSFWYSRAGEVCGFPRALSRIKFFVGGNVPITSIRVVHPKF